MRRWGAIKTKRLIIKPLDDASLGKLLHRQTDPELIKAYGDMLLGCCRQPAARLWYTAWSISLYDGTMVGDICFKGPPNERGEVEIGYGILDGHQGHGYATEAVRAMCTWGFSMPGCYFIQAQTEPGNRASERVLEKSGFPLRAAVARADFGSASAHRLRPFPPSCVSVWLSVLPLVRLRRTTWSLAYV